jgi:hypothetical protein
MLYKSLLALMPVGTVVLFLIGWAAPTASLAEAPDVLPASPAQPQKTAVAVAAPPHCPVDPAAVLAIGDKCDEMFRATRQALQPARPDRCVAPWPKVAAWPPPPMPPADCPPPVPPADKRCDVPGPRCATPAPPPCHEQCGPHHTTTIYNGACVKEQTYVWRSGSWQSRGKFHR